MTSKMFFKKNILWIILILITLIIALIGYYFKNELIFVISVLLPGGVLSIHIKEKSRILSDFNTGNYKIKDDINFSKIVFEKTIRMHPLDKLARIIYHSISIFLFFIVVTYFNISKPEYITTTGLSLISVGVALSILSFSHANSLDNKSVNKKIIFASARRFYLATILSILYLMVILLIRYFLTNNPIEFIDIMLYMVQYVKTFLTVILGFFYIILLLSIVKILIDGFILAIIGTLE